MEYKFSTTPERSQLMKKIKSTGTKSEEKLRKALWSRGIRYRKNYSKLPGKPDIVITTKKIVIFIDGEFWHGFNWNDKKDKIKANREYWIPKIERNMQRDKLNNQILQDDGWTVLRFWENDIKKDLSGCIDSVMSYIESRD